MHYEVIAKVACKFYTILVNPVWPQPVAYPHQLLARKKPPYFAVFVDFVPARTVRIDTDFTLLFCSTVHVQNFYAN